MENTLEIKKLKEENRQLQETIFSLKEQLEWFHRQVFGNRSERIVATNEKQLLLNGFENKANQEKQVIETHERVKPNRQGQDEISFPENLPVERIYLDIPEDQKICPKTGIALVKIGEEVSQKLANKPGSYFIKEIIRPKYANPKNSDEGIKIAELPPSLLPRCFADTSLLADILVKKYADHLPLNRISEILNRDGINISRQLLSKWVIKSGLALKPLHEEMQKQILESQNVFMDEVPVEMLAPGTGKTKLTYIWVLSGGKELNPAYRVYSFKTNRKHHNAEELLKGYHGVLHSDKYGAYEVLAQKKQVIWCPCWAHIRRKFFEAEHGDRDFRDWVLSKINKLFEIEKVAWTQSPKERLRIRQEEETPIIDELTEAIKERRLGYVLPKSNFKEALNYYCELIPYVKNYTFHDWARLDNNVSERAVRPIALGRKNWLFIGNEESGEAAGIILSLVQTCRALEINPRDYLQSVMEQLLDYNNKKLQDLLPDHWAKNHLP